MTRKINIKNIRKIKKAGPLIESRVKINISYGKDYVVIKGSVEKEFLVEEILYAIDFGFLAEDAFLLLKEGFLLKFIDIRSNTSRNNLRDVRARIIGKKGRVKQAIEKLTGAMIVIKENTIGIIVDDLHLDTTVQAIKTLIHGTKHGTVFSYLERKNRTLKHLNIEDLGLKNPERDLKNYTE